MPKKLIYLFVFSLSLSLALYHQTSTLGTLSLTAILTAFCIRPLVQIMPSLPFAKKFLVYRRQIGNSSAIFLAGHLYSQITKHQTVNQLITRILNSSPASNLFWGMLGLLMIIPMALTSNDHAVRSLKRNWKKIHLLIHPLVIFVLIHRGLREGYYGLIQSVYILSIVYGLRVLAKIKA